MNLTSSFLFLSDQLEYVVHLLLYSVVLLLPVSLKLLVFEKTHDLLAPENTAVKPALFVILHLQDPSLQYFPLCRNRSASVTGCKTCRHQIFKIHPHLRR